MTIVFLCAVCCWFIFLWWIHTKLDVGAELLDTDEEPTVHVVIPFRNEASTLGPCLRALQASEGIKRPILVWLVDDHSTDDSRKVIEEVKDKADALSIRIMENEGQGKKQALLTALKELEHDWVYLTDADCRVEPSTISSMISRAALNDAKVVFGPVLYDHSARTVWDRVLSYENLNTQIVSEAFVRKGKPVMVNGGNLLIHATHLETYVQSLHMEYASGDDVFFAHQLGDVDFTGAYDLTSAVHTAPPGSLSELWRQRRRWASKYKGYRQSVARILPPVVFVFNLIFTLLFISLFFLPTLLHVWTVIWLLKWGIEFSFHRYWFRKYDFAAGIFESMVLSIVYPMYYVALGTSVVISKRFSWKGRIYEQ